MSMEKEVGRLQSDVASLKDNYTDMDVKLDRLIKASDEQKGARRTLHFIYVVIIAIVTLKIGNIKDLLGG